MNAVLLYYYLLHSFAILEPGEPQGFKATNPGTTQVILKWEEPTPFSGKVLSYIVS